MAMKEFIWFLADCRYMYIHILIEIIIPIIYEELPPCTYINYQLRCKFINNSRSKIKQKQYGDRVPIDFGKILYSVLSFVHCVLTREISGDRKHRIPYGKRRMPFVCGHHYEDSLHTHRRYIQYWSFLN